METIKSLEEFFAECKRTEPSDEDYQYVIDRIKEYPILIKLIHAQMGMTTEVGELTDTIKKAVFYGKKIDWPNIVEEDGDFMWYVAIIFFLIEQSTGCPPMEVLQLNINKLKRRYPEKFSEQDALERKDKDNYPHPEHLG